MNLDMDLQTIDAEAYKKFLAWEASQSNLPKGKIPYQSFYIRIVFYKNLVN